MAHTGLSGVALFEGEGMVAFDDRGSRRGSTDFRGQAPRTEDGHAYRSNVAAQRERDLSGVSLGERGEFDGGLKDLVEVLLKRNPAVFIGDSHGNFAIAENLIQNMPNFKNAGVAVLFFEMVKSADQSLLERCAKTANYDDLVGYLQEGWDKVDGMAKKYAEVVEAAHKAGIKVVGVDTEHTGDSRLESSNPHWVRVITDEAKKLPLGEKYLVFGGAGHSANYEFNKGVDFELGIPSVDLTDTAATKDYIVRGDSKESDFVLGLRRSPNQPSSIFDNLGKQYP